MTAALVILGVLAWLAVGCVVVALCERVLDDPLNASDAGDRAGFLVFTVLWPLVLILATSYGAWRLLAMLVDGES